MKYLDNVFSARQLPAIAWQPFLAHLVACVGADGGIYNETHQYFEFPPKITGKEWLIVSVDEIKKYLKW